MSLRLKRRNGKQSKKQQEREVRHVSSGSPPEAVKEASKPASAFQRQCSGSLTSSNSVAPPHPGRWLQLQGRVHVSGAAGPADKVLETRFRTQRVLRPQEVHGEVGTSA